MTTLITGAGGFIGLNVTEQLLAAGLDVVALAIGPLHPEALRAFQSLPGHFSVETGDIIARLPAEDTKDLTLLTRVGSVLRGALRRELVTCLRTGRALRVPRARTRRGKAFVSPDVMITERPPEANDRAVPGHW